jgi:hypothetical protein
MFFEEELVAQRNVSIFGYSLLKLHFHLNGQFVAGILRFQK